MVFHADIVLQRYWNHNDDLLESRERDFIGHVTTGLTKRGFLFIVRFKQPSISNSFLIYKALKHRPIGLRP